MLSAPGCFFILIWVLFPMTVRVSSQGPGDEDAICLDGTVGSRPSYPPNTVALLDTYHYLTLLGSPFAKLIARSFDTDTSTWVQQGSNPCNQVVFVCASLPAGQNNWLITQHINTTANGVALSQIIVNITYSSNCMRGTTCQQLFYVHKYETAAINPTASLNTTNYDTAGISVVLGNNPYRSFSGTAQVKVPLGGNGGLYLAIRDTGICVVITRLIVYYSICPQQVVNFVRYPKVIVQSSLVFQTLECVTGATLIGQFILATCSAAGWQMPLVKGSCNCNPGYYNESQLCHSCVPGTHKSSQGSGTCLPCPSNSNTSFNGSTECPCLPGYYRELSSGLADGCILQRLPSAPKNLIVYQKGPTHVTLQWSPPMDNGGMKVLYKVIYHRTDQAERIETLPTIINTTVNVTNLFPSTEYSMRVIANNSLPGNEEDRSVSIIVITASDDNNVEVNHNLPTGSSSVVIANAVTGSALGLVILVVVVAIILCLFRRVLKIDTMVRFQQGEILEMNDHQMSNSPHANPAIVYEEVMNTISQDGFEMTASSAYGLH